MLSCFTPIPYDIEFYNQGVELELLKLEVAVQSIHDNLLLLKSKFVHPLVFLASCCDYSRTWLIIQGTIAIYLTKLFSVQRS